MPVFVFYGVFLPSRKVFLADWLPLLSGTVLFDAIRGAIYIAVQGGTLAVFPAYVIELERMFFRTPAVPIVFQSARNGTLDAAAVFLHGSHFAFFLLFGLTLWHLKPSEFGYFRRVLLLIMAGGLIGYAAVPTVPPWLAASEFSLLPPIDHVIVHVYTRHFPELYGAFDSNPVAAMPSLHAAFPVACATVAWRAFGRSVGIALGLYATCLILAVMYLGEHYAVDIVAGIVLAAAAAWLGRPSWSSSLSFRKALALSALAICLTIGTLSFVRQSFPGSS
jgi:membrane-associated phospholipid phosphatase